MEPSQLVVEKRKNIRVFFCKKKTVLDTRAQISLFLKTSIKKKIINQKHDSKTYL